MSKETIKNIISCVGLALFIFVVLFLMDPKGLPVEEVDKQVKECISKGFSARIHEHMNTTYKSVECRVSYE